MTIQTFVAGQTLTASQMNALQASDFNYTINTQGGINYTIALSDLGKLIRFTNSGSIIVDVPLNSSAPFDVGDVITLLLDSTGTITVSPTSGVTISSEGNIFTLETRYSIATLIKIATDSWILTGVVMNTILDDEVTTAKIDNGAITNAKLAANSVTSDKIAPGTVIAADIAAGTITATELADGAVTSGKILDETIVNADINASAAIAHSKLASITAGSVLLGNASNVPTATALSGDVTVNSSGVTEISSGIIVNADINASAAIDKTKISGTAITAADTGTVTSTMIADGTIVNADINASAAIALSKLASGTSGQIIVANSSGVPTWVSETGDVTISNTGVTAISSGVIVNADVSTSASIAYSKLNLSGSITSSDIADGTIVNADISDSASIGLGKLADATIDEKSASYTLVLADKNKFIKMSVTTTANTVTVPTNSSVAFPVGSQIHVIQYGTGKTQVVGDSGVVIYATPGAYLRAQYSSATLLKCDTNIWMLMGDLSAS